MANTITTKKFASNVIVSVSAQIISMAVSVVIALIVPKFISERQFSFWQVYTLYAGYVGVLHFGLLDGIILRYSKFDYNELEKERLRSQFLILLLITSALSFVTLAITGAFAPGEYLFVFIFVGAAIITKNICTYGSYLFQVTNRINNYAGVIVGQRLVFLAGIAILLILRVNTFVYFCLADLVADITGIILCMLMNRGLFFGLPLPPREAFREAGINISSGILLMLANWSASLMVGGAKMIVQWHWDQITFGKVAFAFTLSNFFLTFVSAISVVMFPSLQRIEREKLPDLYIKVRRGTSILLFCAMIFYFLGSFILRRWLPNYAASLTYLGILLPIMVYSSRVSLLTNNYLKAYRKERRMMVINLISIALGAASFVLCAYVFNNLTALLCCAVGTVMFNSIASEICVLGVIKRRITVDFFVEAIMSAGFIAAARLLSLWHGALMYAGLLVAYTIFNYKVVVALIGRLARKKGGKSE